MPTVDASVWVSAFDTKDRFHHESAAFLGRLTAAGTVAHAPTMVTLEVACALSRRYADPAVWQRALDRLRVNPFLHLVPLDENLLSESVRMGALNRLRAADALYAAAAGLETGGVLVSWDNELIERAGAVTPADWPSPRA